MKNNFHLSILDSGLSESETKDKCIINMRIDEFSLFMIIPEWHSSNILVLF